MERHCAPWVQSGHAKLRIMLQHVQGFFITLHSLSAWNKLFSSKKNITSYNTSRCSIQERDICTVLWWICIWEEISSYVRSMVTSNTWLSRPTELTEVHWYWPLSSGTTAGIVSTWLPVETEARSNGMCAPCLNHSTSGFGVPPTKQSRDKESLSLAVILSSGFFRKKGGTRAGRARKRDKRKG